MKKIVFLSALVAMLLAACQSPKETYNFAGKILTLTELSGVEYNPETTERPVALIFGEKDNSLSGNVGCNLVRGKYYANEDTLTFPQPMAMTRMMCDPVSNEIEMKMVSLLNGADRYVVADNDGVPTITVFAGEEKLAVFTVTEKENCCGEKKECCGEKKEGCCSDKKECCGEGKDGCCKDKCCKGNGTCDKDSCCQKGKGTHECINGICEPRE